MRAKFISFARLVPGSYFDARGDTWVKCPGILFEGGVRFNAYNSVFDREREDAPVQTNFFPDEMLVKFDPNEARAPWSYEKEQAGD